MENIIVVLENDINHSKKYKKRFHNSHVFVCNKNLLNPKCDYSVFAKSDNFILYKNVTIFETLLSWFPFMSFLYLKYHNTKIHSVFSEIFHISIFKIFP